jgi:hypothetical protein
VSAAIRASTIHRLQRADVRERLARLVS